MQLHVKEDRVKNDVCVYIYQKSPCTEIWAGTTGCAQRFCFSFDHLGL